MSHKAKAANSERHTAIHEAGHAVIGRVLSLVCGETTIVSDHVAGHAGYSITEDHYECEAAWRSVGKWREQNAALHARIMTFMAGSEAEVELLGSSEGGDADDHGKSDGWQKS